ncbi:hypothetical protein SCHPADRAFT_896531 [Schizopora paradoxa]|uniref:Uncharacterized protein n=1 Tax=Schizopora paradoxa TaxID=27342 RepID=A0A0H2R1B5_9AGAM|nr:hypothetical protein SCHPADRAFT_896531 [Schizopora paradoxa]
MKIEGNLQTVLRIPSSEIPKYTNSPIEWLQYLDYVIYGAQGSLVDADGISVDVTKTIGGCAIYQFIPTRENPDTLVHFEVIKAASESSASVSHFGIEKDWIYETSIVL